jgi:hypothetical protein
MTSPIIRCRVNVFTELLPSKDREKHVQTHTRASNKSYTAVYIRCRGNVFTKPLPSNNAHTDVQTVGNDL